MDEKRSVMASTDNNNSKRLRLRFFLIINIHIVNAFPIVPMKNNKTSIVAVNKSIGVKGSASEGVEVAGDVELEWYVVVGSVDSVVSMIAATVEFKVWLKFIVDAAVDRTVDIDVGKIVVVKLLLFIVGKLSKMVEGLMSKTVDVLSKTVEDVSKTAEDVSKTVDGDSDWEIVENVESKTSWRKVVVAVCWCSKDVVDILLFNWFCNIDEDDDEDNVAFSILNVDISVDGCVKIVELLGSTGVVESW